MDPRLRDRGFTEAQLEALEAEFQKKLSGNEHKALNLKFTGDLYRFNYPYFDYVMSLFTAYEMGHLPFEGPLSQQPSKIIEIFEILTHLKFEAKQRHAEQQKREAERLRKK